MTHIFSLSFFPRYTQRHFEMQWKTAANLKAAAEKSKPEVTVRELQVGPAHSRSETGDLVFSSVR